MRATGSRVGEKKVIRNNTVGPLLVRPLVLRGGGGRAVFFVLQFVVLQIRELEVCTAAGHHGSLSPPVVVSAIHS